MLYCVVSDVVLYRVVSGVVLSRAVSGVMLSRAAARTRAHGFSHNYPSETLIKVCFCNLNRRFGAILVVSGAWDPSRSIGHLEKIPICKESAQSELI